MKLPDHLETHRADVAQLALMGSLVSLLSAAEIVVARPKSAFARRLLAECVENCQVAFERVASAEVTR